MSTRRKTSGGQAIVMVTVALIAMCGMIGLAVDLGWSFFVKKQAQTAADSAALGAVQEAYRRLTSSGAIISAFTCPGSPTANTPYCQPQGVGNAAADCQTISSTTTSNLYDGCLYAKSATSNGFDYSTAASRQKVWMQANDASTLPNQPATPSGQPLGVNQLVYWVTATTVQTIPQLFSSVMGNTQGTVSAVATAAIASSLIKGSFYGMDHQGDCAFDTSTASFKECGVDVDANGNGGTCNGQANIYLCAPAGVILSSTCHSSTQIAGQCTTTGYAGAGGAVYGGPGIFVNTNGANGIKPGDLSKWNPSPVGSGPIGFNDPTQNTPQPPIAAGPSAISSCGYPGGSIPAAAGKGATQVLGPFQFYSFNPVTKIPDGKPIILPTNVKFDPAANTQALGCPSTDGGVTNGVWQAGANTQSANGAFRTFILWGGINGTDPKLNATFLTGQYILAGSDLSNNITGGGTGDNVFTTFGGTVTGADRTTAGNMFILTDPNYVGGGTTNPTNLGQQSANIPNYAGSTLASLSMGSVDLKDATVTLNGFNKANLGSALTTMDATAYDGILIWQDRRNTTLEYNRAPTAACPIAECTKDDGTVVSGPPNYPGPAGCQNCASVAQIAENHVTNTSPGLSMEDGNGSKVLNGVIYQPRGAWWLMNPGTAQVNNSPLQIITGQLICGSACGNTQVTLTSPSIPFIRFVATLIQ